MPELTSRAVAISKLDAVDDAVCFAILSSKQRRVARNRNEYWTCEFRDANDTVRAKVWSDAAWFNEVESWIDGSIFRLEARIEDKGYGRELRLRSARPTTTADEGSFDPAQLFPTSIRKAEDCWLKIREFVDTYVTDSYLATLVLSVLDAHADLFLRIQAARDFHHAYVGGLVEHVWSMTRLAVYTSEHYARYYPDLEPPLNRSLVIAAVILHDIGKLKELEFTPAQARYTDEGRLIGHIVIGRDIARDAAAAIPGFPAETLMLLEHAILAHHGTRAFGSPVEPQTLEALIVSQLDLLDAKVNAVALARMQVTSHDSLWTDKIFACENRAFYRGRVMPQPEHTETSDDVSQSIVEPAPATG